MEPWLSVVVMTPATAPPPGEALDAPAETAVVPVRTVCAMVVVEEPLAAAAWTCEQKLFPTEMIWVGSTGGLAAAHTEMEQSRTPKPKFMLLQRHW